MEHSPLRNRTYRRLFGAQVASLIGTGFTTVALALLAYDLAGGKAGAVLGTALALKMVAYVGVAPVAGALVHRVPRRTFLVTLDVARAAMVMCLPWVTEIWHIYMLIFLLNACSAAFTPTFQATIPDVLPDDRVYTRALSLSRLAYDLENLLSPALAAMALLVMHYDALFAMNAAAFAVSAALVLSTRLPSPQPSQRDGGIWRNLAFGTRAYLATPRLRGLLALSLAVASAGAMVIVNTVVYVRDQLNGSEVDVTIALAASGAGSMIAALALPHFLDRQPDRPFMLAGGVLLAIGLLLGTTQPGLMALLPIWFVLGVGSSLVQTPTGRLLKRSAIEADRPAIFAAQFALSHACWLVGYWVAGHVGSTFGLTFTFAALALITMVGTVVASRAWPSHDPIDIEHTHDVISHDHVHVHDQHHRHAHDGSEGPEPHRHAHLHEPLTHSHAYTIDAHHERWPNR